MQNPWSCFASHTSVPLQYFAMQKIQDLGTRSLLLPQEGCKCVIKHVCALLSTSRANALRCISLWEMLVLPQQIL